MSKENDAVYLHDNVMTKGRFFGKPTRNWVEGLIGGIVMALIMKAIPFVSSVKVLMMIVGFLAMLILGVLGAKNRSYTQPFVAWIKYRHNRRRLHLRTPDYIRNVKYEEEENESFAETAYRKANEGIDRFVERYRTK